MYQKRKRPSFKNDLRAQLLNKALELNEAPVKRGFGWANWQGFFVRRMAPAVATVMVVALAFQFLLPTGGMLPQLVNVAEAKDYYTLTPETEDDTGVASESNFVLSSKGELDVDEVEAVLSVQPQAELLLEQISDTEVLVNPVESLDPGEVYSFTLEAQNMDESPYPKEYNWAYEVSDGFRVTGTLPGQREAGVPINTGIEITFTHIGVSASDFENAFSISPAVSGQFEVNGKIGVFAPSGGLKEATVYTVAISGSLGLEGLDKTLGKDYVFEFETNSETRTATQLSFPRSVYEFSPSETPQMQFYYWDDNEVETTVGVSVYVFGNGEDFVSAMQTKNEEVPAWTYCQRSLYRVPTDGLNKIVDIPEYTFVNDSGNWIILPDALPEGSYLLELTKNDAVVQVFVQISTHAVYLNLNEANTVVWVNDTTSGKTVEGATVEILDSGLSEETNKDGVVKFENLYDALQLEENQNQMIFFSVTAEGKTTYYQASFYLGADTPNQNTWQFMNTDRVTYLPTDTVHYWGFVQGREEAVEEEATVYVLQGYYWGYGDIEELLQKSPIISEEKISIKDGEAFEGKVDINKLTEGSYQILLVQNGRVLSDADFYVSGYVKPAYDIQMEADKTALFKGDIAHITITAEFFDGTPVVDTLLQINPPDGEIQYVKTDDNGEIALDWVATNDSCLEEDCRLFNNRYFSVTPSQEELGEIYESLGLKVFNSKSAVDEANQTFTNTAFDFQTFKVDLAQAQLDAVYDETDSTSRVEMTVTQVDYVRTEVGEYYDENDKVVRKEYEYNREEKDLGTSNLSPDGNGKYHYDANLSDEHDYEVALKVFDSDGNYYVDNANISNGHSYIGYGSSLHLVGGTATLGENVTVEVVQDNPEISYEGIYLFMENQNGVQKLELREEPSYTFEFGEEHVPNVFLSTVLFDGTHYRESGFANVALNTEDRRMDLTVTADQDTYEPGEEVTLDIKASEAGQVNLYLVDEAYYALFSESFRDPLELIYSDLPSAVDYTYASHKVLTFTDDGGKGGCFVTGTQILMADGSSKSIEEIQTGDLVLTRSSAWNPLLVPVKVLNTIEHTVGEYLLVNGNLGVTEEHVIFFNGKFQLAGDLKVGDFLLNSEGEEVPVESIVHVRDSVKVYNFETEDKHTYFANGIYVHNDKDGAREDFRDTAFFQTVQTDANGNASVTFELPDNITSWRISAAAVSGGKEIHAGYTSEKLVVSKDVFINPIINSTYLTGDETKIPVRAYGDALEAGTSVDFSFQIEDVDSVTEAQGKAYETTYFDLTATEVGDYRIITRGKADGGSDTVILPIKIVDSHLTQNAVSETLLTENSKLEGSAEERTTVVYLNNETGIVYGTLLEALYEDGDRADEVLARTLSAEWLNEYFDEDVSVPEFSTFVYQKTAYANGEYGDGGIALLPYADSDLELSAKLAALAPEQFSTQALTQYFENILNSGDRTLSEKILALYGLAGIDQAYLTELNYFIRNFELSQEDKLYAALAYGEYGQDLQATVLFLEIKDAEEDAAGGGVLLATLAQNIGSDLADTLWEKALETEGEESILLEKMLFTKARLEMGAQKKVSFEINGESFDLSGNEYARRSYLPEELAGLQFSNLSGDVRAVSSYETPINLDELGTDDSVALTRSYFVNGQEVQTVKVGDIVEVHLKATAVGNFEDFGFKVTDYLPSGMQTATFADNVTSYNTDDDYYHPYDQDGQAVSFYVSCHEGSCKYGKEFYYLARVINPGSFVLEPAVIQNYQDPEVINISGARTTMTIE
ncbi:MAG: polymorphic toxin-type HINT domain-containing protein [Candidatus Gracilibacteria bacterium]